jgi:hypothetical protein
MSPTLLCRLSMLVCILMFLPVPFTYSHQHGAGPEIIVLSPHDGDTVTAPFELEVRFVAPPDADIDTESLKVKVQKLLWGVDVTKQVKRFTSAEGIHITDADFPKGHHTVTLQIADERGRLTSKTVTMDVR